MKTKKILSFNVKDGESTKINNNITFRHAWIDKVDGPAFYNISSDFDNNTFIVDIGGGPQTITLTDGTYDTIAELATEIQTQLQVIDGNFTATISSTTMKITITYTGVFTLTISDNNFPAISGFIVGTYNTLATYSSSYVINLRPFSAILVNLTHVLSEEYTSDGYLFSTSIPLSSKFYQYDMQSNITMDIDKTDNEYIMSSTTSDRAFDSIYLSASILLNDDTIKKIDFNNQPFYIRIAYC